MGMTAGNSWMAGAFARRAS